MMNQPLRQKILEVCQQKIKQKGDQVGVSFYAFSSNKNHDPEALMELATWWILQHRLDHFERRKKSSV